MKQVLTKYQTLPIGKDGANTRALATFRELLEVFPRDRAFYFRRGEIADREFRPTQTILAIDPFETIRIRDRKAVIETAEGEREEEVTDAFSYLSRRMEDLRQEKIPELPSFQGGALGYFSYDSVRDLEPILRRTDGNLARSDGKYDAEIMFFRKVVIFDHEKDRVIFIAGTQPEIDELVRIHQAARARKPAQVSGMEHPELSVSDMESMHGKESFLKKVRAIKEYIRDGDIFQAVLSEKFSAPYEGDPLDLFEILCDLSPSPYQFCFLSGKRAFVGSSPEMLLQVNERELETHPIAGTRPRGATEAEEERLCAQLLRSPKEKAEHLMLVDLSRNDLGRVSDPGTIRIGSYMKIRKFSGVMHLVSVVKGTLNRKYSPIMALASCFPAGTLSGAPKIRAMQRLSELEPLRRGFYGGAVIAASFTGDLDSCISIRGIEIEGGVATIQAGAGIVADSSPEREYAEIQHKTSGTRRALALALAWVRSGARAPIKGVG